MEIAVGVKGDEIVEESSVLGCGGYACLDCSRVHASWVSL